MPPSKRKQKKVSTARRKAEQAQTGGGDFSCFKIPDGMEMWKPKAGVYKIDILGFDAGDHNQFAAKGEFHYETTYHMHPRVGGENGSSYCCPLKMRKKKCPICEEQSRMGNDPDADDKTRKSLLPKKRQLFIIRDHETPDKLFLWEFSYHNFGKLLDSRIETSDEEDGFEFFYFYDEDGMALKIAFQEETSPFGKYVEAKHIDFIPRKKPLSKSLIEKVVCLDDILKIEPYDQLRATFLQLEEDDEDEDEDEDEDTKPSKKKKTKASPSRTSDAKKLKKLAVEADDEEDEDAIDSLTDRAEAVDLDVDDFKNWKAVAAAIIEAESEEEDEDDEEEEPKPSKKKKKKKGKKKTAEDYDDDDDEVPF